jgi:hypothetical protein
MPRRNDIAKILVIGSGLVILLGFACSVLSADVFVQQRIKFADACGLVVDPSGLGVPGATVTAQDDSGTLVKTTSLNDGSFHFSETFDTSVDLRVESRGFVRADNRIGTLRTAKSSRCRHPIYVVLAVGEGFSNVTTMKSALPKPGH